MRDISRQIRNLGERLSARLGVPVLARQCTTSTWSDVECVYVAVPLLLGLRDGWHHDAPTTGEGWQELEDEFVILIQRRKG